MPLYIVRNDITKMGVDAIVNPTDEAISGTGGIDAVIQKNGGKKLKRECKLLNGCKVGEAKITNGYDLPAKYVIHTAGPVYKNKKEDTLLASCYQHALELAMQYSIESIAFPLISSGSLGYPKDLAWNIAIKTISDFLFANDLEVYLVVFDKESFYLSKKIYDNVKEYIDEFYVDENMCYSRREICESAIKPRKIKDLLIELDETFSQMLLRKIDEFGMTDSECYKKANIDRKLFSKIRCNINYKPKKTTAVAFAIALELDLDETEELLKKAGYALSNSSKFDVIIKYFIENENYDIYEINSTLFEFDQVLLGE